MELQPPIARERLRQLDERRMRHGTMSCMDIHGDDKRSNAGRQARLEAEARDERRLEGVACTPWLGADLADEKQLHSSPIPFFLWLCHLMYSSVQSVFVISLDGRLQLFDAVLEFAMSDHDNGK